MALRSKTWIIVVAAVVGGIVLLLAVAIVVYIVRRRRRKNLYRIKEEINDRLTRYERQIKSPLARGEPMPTGAVRPPQVQQLKNLLVKEAQIEDAPSRKANRRTLTKRQRTLPLALITESKVTTNDSSSNTVNDGNKYSRRHHMVQSHSCWKGYTGKFPGSNGQRSLSQGANRGPGYLKMPPSYQNLRQQSRIPVSNGQFKLKRSFSDSKVTEAPTYAAPSPPQYMAYSQRINNPRMSQSPVRGSVDSTSSSILGGVASPNWRKLLFTNPAPGNSTSDDHQGVRNTGLSEWESQEYETSRIDNPAVVRSPGTTAVALVHPKRQTQTSCTASVEGNERTSYRKSFHDLPLATENSSGLSLSLLNQSLTPAVAKLQASYFESQENETSCHPPDQRICNRKTGSIKIPIRKTRQDTQQYSLALAKQRRTSTPEPQSLRNQASSEWTLDGSSTISGYDTIEILHRKRSKSFGELASPRRPTAHTSNLEYPVGSSAPDVYAERTKAKSPLYQLENSKLPVFFVSKQKPRDGNNCQPASDSFFCYTPRNSCPKPSQTTALPTSASEYKELSKTPAGPVRSDAVFRKHVLDPPEILYPSPQATALPPCPSSPRPGHVKLPSLSDIGAQKTIPRASHPSSDSTTQYPFRLPPPPPPPKEQRQPTETKTRPPVSRGLYRPQDSPTRSSRVTRDSQASTSPLQTSTRVSSLTSHSPSKVVSSSNNRTSIRQSHSQHANSLSQSNHSSVSPRMAYRPFPGEIATSFPSPPSGGAPAVPQIAAKLRRMDSFCDADASAYFALGAGDAGVYAESFAARAQRKAGEALYREYSRAQGQREIFGTDQDTNEERLRSIERDGLPIDPRLLALDANARRQLVGTSRSTSPLATISGNRSSLGSSAFLGQDSKEKEVIDLTGSSPPPERPVEKKLDWSHKNIGLGLSGVRTSGGAPLDRRIAIEPPSPERSPSPLLPEPGISPQRVVRKKSGSKSRAEAGGSRGPVQSKTQTQTARKTHSHEPVRRHKPMKSLGSITASSTTDYSRSGFGAGSLSRPGSWSLLSGGDMFGKEPFIEKELLVRPLRVEKAKSVIDANGVGLGIIGEERKFLLRGGQEKQTGATKGKGGKGGKDFSPGTIWKNEVF